MQGRTSVVFGASGYLGRSICEHLATDNPAVAFVRDVARAPAGRNLIPAPMGAITKGPPGIGTGELGIAGTTFTVFQCVGSSRERRTSYTRETNLLATRHAVAWALANGASRVVYFSGFGLSDSTSSVYFRSKRDAELELIRACEGRLAYTILRPSYIVGGEDELVPFLMRQVSSGKVETPGTEDYILQPLLMDDVLCLARNLRDAEGLGSGIHDLLGEPVTLVEFYTRILARLGVRVPVTRRPIEAYMREAILDENAALTLSQIGIIASNITGPHTRELFGCSIRGVEGVVEGLAAHWREKVGAGPG